MSDWQRRSRSLERRREAKRPKINKLPDKIFYRILDESEKQTKNKKHVKFRMLGNEETAAQRANIPIELSPIPARYYTYYEYMNIFFTWHKLGNEHTYCNIY